MTIYSTFAIVDAAISARRSSDFQYLYNAMEKWCLHPAVMRAIQWSVDNPTSADPDIATIAQQWPHLSEDGASIAYIASPDHGAANRITKTRPGRYIRRYWPNIPDGVMEKLAANTGASIAIVTGEAMVQALIECRDIYGPKSCMTSGHWASPYHPYRAYADSKLTSWGLAVKRDAQGRIVSRAVLDVENRHYVRIFAVAPDDGIRPFDHEVADWLEGQGYKHIGGWAGKYLALISRANGFICPYIDGNAQTVDFSDDGEIGKCFDWTGTSQSGVSEYTGECDDDDDDDRPSCDHCGERSNDLRPSFHDNEDLCDDCRVRSAYLDDYLNRHTNDCVQCFRYDEDSELTWMPSDHDAVVKLVSRVGTVRHAIEDAALEDINGDYFHPHTQDHLYVELTTGEDADSWCPVNDAVETYDGEQANRCECRQIERGSFCGSWALIDEIELDFAGWRILKSHAAIIGMGPHKGKYITFVDVEYVNGNIAIPESELYISKLDGRGYHISQWQVNPSHGRYRREMQVIERKCANV